LILSDNKKLIRSYDKAYIEDNFKQELNEIELDINKEVIYDNKYKFYLTKNIPTNNAKYLK
jgi:hypothetical protein